MENKARNRILLVLFIGVLMGALDIAIIGPALPVIRSEFDVSERTLSWMFGIYVLFNLVGTPLMARLSDLFGRKMIYVIDVSLFAVGSLIVALSRSFEMVLVGRAIQGFGAGGIFPVASAVIGDTFPPEKRGGALGMIGAVFGVAFLVGPLLGVALLYLASWQWLFLINLPIAVVVIGMALQTLPGRQPGKQTTFDWLGMGLLAVMLASMAWATNHLDTHAFFASLASPDVLPFLILFAALLPLLAAVERRAVKPVLPPELFDRKQLRLAYVLAAGAGTGEASLVFMPLLGAIALSRFGITEKNATFLMAPVVLALAIGAPTAGRLLDRFGSRLVVIGGSAIMAAGMFVLGLFASNMVMFLLSALLIGFGMSALLGAPLRYITLNEARSSERSVAQGVVAAFTSTGQLLGSALVGAIAASRTQASGGDAVAGYSLAFLVVGVVSVVLVLIATMLKNQAEERQTVQRNQHEAGETPEGAAQRA